MKAQRTVIAAGCVAVVLFDLAASLAARRFEFAYARASVGSYFIYLIIGFVAGRGARVHRARFGAIAAATAGFVDASVGWAVSWTLGPGRSPDGTLSPVRWVLTAALVVLFAAAIGYLGGVLGARSRPATSPAP
jgi:uncharacterized membrane protein YeaQ/YmgE (transglycosylase-associated protein family)